VFWMASPIIVFMFFPETSGLELEDVSPETVAEVPVPVPPAQRRS
jgi:hypothetical protein